MGTYVVRSALRYFGLKWRNNSEEMARMLLDGDLMFRTNSDFSELGVAKIAHSATDA
jgi:hypothetical protein